MGISISELVGNPADRSPCECCHRQGMDKDECIDMGCNVPSNWNDSGATDEIEQRLIVFKIRDREFDGMFSIDTGRPGSGYGGAE